MSDLFLLIGYAMTVTAQLVALIIGTAKLKRWLEKSVIDPYVKPIRDDVKGLRNLQAADRETLIKHDQYIHLLLGKQFGGIPNIDQ